MNKLSKAGEQKAMLALESAIKFANDGMTPSEAIVKAAQDATLEAPMVQRLVEAFNVSKTLHHFKKSAGDDRSATFPIASPESIMAELFPPDPMTPAKEAAAAVHPDQRDFVGFLMAKEASETAAVTLPPLVDHSPDAYERDPAFFAKKAIDERGKLVALHKAAEQATREVYWKMLTTFDKIADYFKQATPGEPFDLVEKRAYATYGVNAKNLMDVVVSVGGLDDRRIGIKRAAAEDLGLQQMMFDPEVAPYNHVADAMLLSREVARLAKEAAAVANTVDEHAITNAQLLPERDVLASIDRQVEKRAKKDMPHFTDQDRPKKVKDIYRALKRDHPGMPAEQKARIAARQGKPGKQKQGPPYKAPLSA